MKRIRIFLLASGILFLLSGCGIFHLKGTVPDYEEETYTVSAKIENIVMQEEDVPVQICSSDHENLYLSYYSAEDGSEQYKITEEKGTLTVVKESKKNYGIFVFGDRYASDSYKKVKLTLFIPSSYEGDLSVQTADGDIVIGEVSIGKLTIETKDGDISFEDTAITQSLSCRTKDGNVKGKLAGKISEYNVTTKDGDIDLRFEEEGE